MRRLVILTAANVFFLALAATAVPAAAWATAGANPSATFSFVKQSVSSDVRPQLSYQTRNLPHESRINLQFLEFGAGASWTFAQTLPGPSGTATISALQPGLYRFRIRVLHDQTIVVTSAWHYLNVTTVTSSPSCGVCAILGPIAGAIVGWLLVLL